VAFAAVGLFFTGQVWVDYAYAQQPLTWARATAVSVAQWTLWALLAPVVLWLGRRFRFGRRRWPAALGIHLPVSLVLTVGKVMADAALAAALTGAGRAPFTLLKVYVTFLTYWSLLGASSWFDQYRAARDRAMREAQLQAALARAQVQALKARLHPHFLFNTLNAIAGLMREDVEAAEAVLARLSDLLRLALEDVDAPEVPLIREREFLHGYLEIQKVRFGPRLQVRESMAAETLHLLVPTMALQPLVENAIRHGIGARPGPGAVEISSRLEDGRLVLAVRDDGPGPPPTPREGYGLENTRARLRALYGEEAAFTLAPAPQGGAVARLVLPVRPAADAGTEREPS
jgi:two-component system, LytTR family, sensor kinase